MTLHGDLKAVLTFLMQLNERISSKDFYFIGQQFFVCLSIFLVTFILTFTVIFVENWNFHSKIDKALLCKNLLLFRKRLIKLKNYFWRHEILVFEKIRVNFELNKGQWVWTSYWNMSLIASFNIQVLGIIFLYTYFLFYAYLYQ